MADIEGDGLIEIETLLMADIQTPPLQNFTRRIWLADLEEFVKVIDQLPFLDWTIHPGDGEITAVVEITFNQFCQPAEPEIGAEV